MDMEFQQIALLKKDLSDEECRQFDREFYSRRKDTTIAMVLSIFLGEFGVDRFYLGQIGLGFAKLFLVWLTLFIWWLVDLFLIIGATRRVNLELAQQVYDSIKMMRSDT
ncbi:MAG: TM2 domain-containing protein [Candidatus Hatepunaea meridiana]|nr:TM2 domain-containing protein [Candidatus Hatepunaea meridiana]